MALTEVGGAPLTLNADAVFTPDSTWEKDDLLFLRLVYRGGLGGAGPFVAPTATDDSGGPLGTTLGWHGNGTKGTGVFTDANWTMYGLWARIPAELDGSTDPITVTASAFQNLGSAFFTEGIAVRGGKSVKRRHTATDATNTNDYASSGSGTSPRTATLPAHAPGTNDGDAGAVELMAGYTSSPQSNNAVQNITPSGATSLHTGFHQDWDSTNDVWLATAYALSNSGPAAETQFSWQISGWTSGNKTAFIQRFLWVLQGNYDPTIVIDSVTDLGSREVALVIDSISDDYSVLADTSFPYPYTYDVDWGDGNTDTIDITLDGYTLEPDPFNQLHVYATGGTYTVTVTITDEDGATGTDTMDVLVTGGEPAAAWPPPYEPVSRKVDVKELPHQVNSRMFDEL